MLRRDFKCIDVLSGRFWLALALAMHWQLAAKFIVWLCTGRSETTVGSKPVILFMTSNAIVVFAATEVRTLHLQPENTCDPNHPAEALAKTPYFYGTDHRAQCISREITVNMNKLIDNFWEWALGDAPRTPVPYHDDDDLEWVTAVIPMVFTQSMIHHSGEAAMEHFGPRLGPDWAKFKATDMRQFWYLARILPRHMDTLDPEGTSGAYRMLQNWDPEFRKIKIFGKVYHSETVKLAKELYDLEYLGSYLFVNVMARFAHVNVDLAEEALQIHNTRHMVHFKMVFEEGKTLGDVRADRLKHKKLEDARNERDPMLRLQFEIPLF